MSRLSALVLAAAAGAAAVTLGAGSAEPRVTTLRTRPLLLGVMDDALLGAHTARAFAAVRALGAGIVRYDVDWPQVAYRRPLRARDPDDPGYRFETVDEVVRRARRMRVPLLLTIVHTPKWAGGGHEHNRAPRRMRELEDFAYAAATRYSGKHLDAGGERLPRVTRWEAWNEPNTETHLAPQWVRREGRWHPASPGLYTRILRAIYRGIHAAGNDAGVTETVAGGATKPTGAGPTASEPSVAPLRFVRMLAARRADFDVYAHHPYRISGADATSGDNVGLDDLGRLLATLDRVYPGSRLRLWITEYGVQTNPPDRWSGVPPGQQARMLRRAVAIAHANPRVELLIWFLLHDEAIGGRPLGGGFQTGLAYVSGRRKPAWATFRSLARQLHTRAVSGDP